MGDPVGARPVRQTLKSDESWMIVGPAASGRLEDNLNPVGRMSYAGSTMACIPTSLDQPVGAPSGAQAGFARYFIGVGVAARPPHRIDGKNIMIVINSF